MGKENKVDLSLDGLNDEQRLLVVKARRTAFIARFIVLRESKKSKAHRFIEKLEWREDATAEELSAMIKDIFIQSRDYSKIFERDLKKAMAHVNRSVMYFVKEYAARATNDFIGALYDYEHSNRLLFSVDEQPRPGGWRLPQDLERERLLNLKRQPLPGDFAD